MIGKVNIPEGKKGDWTVEKFTTDHFNFYHALQGRPVPKGETFTRLMRGSTLVMSDTPAEQRDHYGFYNNARGHVLIAGLGLGMILDAVLKKPDVEHATVFELSQDLIDLVGPTYKARYGTRLDLWQADAMEAKPYPGLHYEAAWFDIWDSISDENLPAMRTLKKRWKPHCDWVGCWAERECNRLAREEREHEKFRRMFRTGPNAFDDLKGKLEDL